MTTSSLTSTGLDEDQARNAIGAVSVGLGALAVLAPVRTAGVFGVAAATGSGPLLVRMVGARNLVMGLRTLQATGDEQKRALQAGLVVGAVDVAAMVLAAAKGRVSKARAAVAIAVLAAIAAAGVAALDGDVELDLG